MLDTWDSTVIARFDAMRSSQPMERAACGLMMDRRCVRNLDHTLHDLRRRAQRRGVGAMASEPELTLLRSAAVEVAVGAYVDGVTWRRERDYRAISSGCTAADERSGSTLGIARRRGARRPVLLDSLVIVLLPAELLAGLDGLVREAMSEGPRRRGGSWGPEDALEDLRSAAVEAAIGAWLAFRGY